MDSHQIRQQQRKKWLALKRERYGKGFLASEEDETDNAVIVFGYEARIFGPSKRSINANMISLAEGDTLVDRYDIRHLLCMTAYRRKKDVTGDTVADPGMDARRFKSLGTVEDERRIFDMHDGERRAYIRKFAHPESEDTAETGGMALKYDQEGKPVAAAEFLSQPDQPEAADEASTDPQFKASFAVPDGMAVPGSQRHFEIIERTARFISSQPADRSSQMELTIQGKQGTNSDFRFLDADNPLYPFYKHVKWLMQTGLYGYNDDSDPDSDPPPAENPKCEPKPKSGESSPSDGDKQGDGEAAMPVRIPKDIVVPDDNIRAIVDKVAKLVGQSADPSRLETKLRVEKATSMSMYSFLSPFDKSNGYYVFRRDCFAGGLEVEEIVQTPAPPVVEGGESKMAKRRRLAKEFLSRKKMRPV